MTHEKEIRSLHTKVLAKSDADKTRTLTFTASDESQDRMGDVIRASGWVLENFRKNPVICWSHRTGDPPIGRATRTEVRGKSLVMDIQFASYETFPFAATIFKLYKSGFMNAVSVGFLPLGDPEIRRDESGNFLGYEFTKQELLECSCVTVPANPSALVQSRSLEDAAKIQRLLDQLFSAPSDTAELEEFLDDAAVFASPVACAFRAVLSDQF